MLNLWNEVLRKLPHFFAGDEMVPALLHGDLWSGNAAVTSESPGMEY